MSILMMLALGSKRVPQTFTQTFTSNQTFKMPAGVSLLTSASGRGAAGSPGTPGSSGQNGYRQTTETTFFRRDGGPNDVVRSSGVIPGSPVPGNYCTERTISMSESVVYNFRRDCYYYEYAYIPGTGSDPTTGASATGFGKVFPGGYGGPASTTTFNNVAVTPNANYSVVVPSGGIITITWQV